MPDATELPSSMIQMPLARNRTLPAVSNLPLGTPSSGPLGWAKHAFALARQRAVWQDVEGGDQAVARVVDGPWICRFQR